MVNELLTDNFYPVLFKEFRISSFDVSQRVFHELINMVNAINLASVTNLQLKEMLNARSVIVVCGAKSKLTFVPEIVCFITQVSINENIKKTNTL